MSEPTKKSPAEKGGVSADTVVNSLCGCFFISLLLFMVPAALAAKGDIVQIRMDAPTEHVVVKGDTLWDISETFLADPWLWPKVWQANPDIANPHLIYPGDVVALIYRNGRPTLTVQRNAKTKIALTPQGIKRQKSPVGLLDWQALQPFISQDQILSVADLSKGVEVIGNPDDLTRFSQAQHIYTTSPDDAEFHSMIQNSSNDQYAIVHREHMIYDMQNNPLGVHVKRVATAETFPSDVADDGFIGHVFHVTKTNQEIALGDIVIPDSPTASLSEMQMHQAIDQTGYIVDSVSSRTVWSEHDVVIVDVGKNATEQGMVFGIYDRGNTLAMQHVRTQPLIKQGELMIVATFEKVSFGVIVNANTHITRGAQLLAP